MDEQEIWRNISGFERYAVSNYGRVKSNISGKILSARKASNGYMRVNIRKGIGNYEKPTVVHVHRLVAKAFLPLIDGKDYVNHIDGNKENNHVSNLEWVTGKENIVHAINNGLMSPNYSEMAKKSRFNNKVAHQTKAYRKKMQVINQEIGLTKTVLQIDMESGNVINEYLNCYEAARALFGEGTVKDRLISRCARGKCKSAYGYFWKYKESE